MNDHFLWLFIHSTLNLPLSRFLELVLLYFCLVGEKCSYLCEEERVGGS